MGACLLVKAESLGVERRKAIRAMIVVVGSRGRASVATKEMRWLPG